MDIEEIRKRARRIYTLPKDDHNDEKTVIELLDGPSFLVRTGQTSFYPAYQRTYDALTDLASLKNPGIPRAFFIDKDRAKSTLILSFAPGVTMDIALRDKSAEEQEKLGEKSGILLQAMHSLIPEVREDFGDWEMAFKKTISDYIELSLYLKGEKELISFILASMHKVVYDNSPAYVHGGIDLPNFVLEPNGDVCLVDFTDIRVFDPYYDFALVESRIAPVSPAFANGLISGYFKNGIPPLGFFTAFAFYSAMEGLRQTVAKCHAGKTAEGIAVFNKLLADFSCFKREKPIWYKNEASEGKVGA